MNLALKLNKKNLLIMVLLSIFVFSLIFSQLYKMNTGNNKEGLTGKQTSVIIDQISNDTSASSIQKLNSIRSVVSMTETQSASGYNAILFDTSISDDSKVKKMQQLVDSSTVNN